MIRSLAAFALMAGVFMAAMGPTQAAPRHGFVPERTAEDSVREQLMGPDRAVGIVRRANRGRVLSADLVRRGGAPVYRVKVLSEEGVVRYEHVDARTGRLLNGGRR